jgi:hypothetical protein
VGTSVNLGPGDLSGVALPEELRLALGVEQDEALQKRNHNKKQTQRRKEEERVGRSMFCFLLEVLGEVSSRVSCGGGVFWERERDVYLAISTDVADTVSRVDLESAVEAELGPGSRKSAQKRGRRVEEGGWG